MRYLKNNCDYLQSTAIFTTLVAVKQFLSHYALI